MINTYTCRAVERCPLPPILSVHICSISEEDLSYLGVSILIYQDHHTMYSKFNPNTMILMIGKRMCEMYLFMYTYQHNCLYNFFRHGNHTADDLMTLRIYTYICREMNICIYLSAHKCPFI